MCVESLSSLEGYVCIDEITNPREFLVIEVSTFAGGQRLEELLLAFAETQAQQVARVTEEFHNKSKLSFL